VLSRINAIEAFDRRLCKPTINRFHGCIRMRNNKVHKGEHGPIRDV